MPLDLLRRCEVVVDIWVGVFSYLKLFQELVVNELLDGFNLSKRHGEGQLELTRPVIAIVH